MGAFSGDERSEAVRRWAERSAIPLVPGRMSRRHVLGHGVANSHVRTACNRMHSMFHVIMVSPSTRVKGLNGYESRGNHRYPPGRRPRAPAAECHSCCTIQAGRNRLGDKRLREAGLKNGTNRDATLSLTIEAPKRVPPRSDRIPSRAWGTDAALYAARMNRSPTPRRRCSTLVSKTWPPGPLRPWLFRRRSNCRSLYGFQIDCPRPGRDLAGD